MNLPHLRSGAAARNDWRLTSLELVFVALLGWLAIGFLVGVIVGHGVALGTADPD